jgi:antitoxin component of MazEF toxin-antitoxin module
MITTLTNFGDSLGVRFPKSLLKNIQIFENEDVEVFIVDNSIVIKRLEKKKHLTTKERIAAFGETMEHIQLSETNWGKPQGKEIW